MMKIGGHHRWKYNSRWHEQKLSRRRWRFVVLQTKRRTGRQFTGAQGAPIGATFFWRIRATQRMTKIAPNTYRGRMYGHKTLHRARIHRN